MHAPSRQSVYHNSSPKGYIVFGRRHGATCRRPVIYRYGEEVCSAGSYNTSLPHAYGIPHTHQRSQLSDIF